MIRRNRDVSRPTVNQTSSQFAAGRTPNIKSKLAHAFRVMAPTLSSALAFSAGVRAGLDSQREDVHPYEEAQGFQRLLDMPGYDVAALVEKSGKSASHTRTSTPPLSREQAVSEVSLTSI